MTKGVVFDIKEFAAHDGSGVRITVLELLPYNTLQVQNTLSSARNTHPN